MFLYIPIYERIFSSMKIHTTKKIKYNKEKKEKPKPQVGH